MYTLLSIRKLLYYKISVKDVTMKIMPPKLPNLPRTTNYFEIIRILITMKILPLGVRRNMFYFKQIITLSKGGHLKKQAH
jgi:hypothetical protein